MNYIYIDEFILDEKYWKYEIGTVYYSRHDHLNNPFETYNTCANCSGALCDGCKYIVENSNFEFHIRSDELYKLITEKRNIDKDIARELVYSDSCRTIYNDHYLVWPTDYILKTQHKDFYDRLNTIDRRITDLLPKLTTELGYKIKTFVDVENAVYEETKLDKHHISNQLHMYWDSKGSLIAMMDSIINPNRKG